MEKKDKLSIITTFYNCDKFLGIALNSVNVQIIDADIDVEYIVVDDHSTDKSREVAEDFIKNHFNNPNIQIKLIETPENLGCGGARKFGIDNATGDYFMFLDGDDYYLNRDFVSRAYKDIKSMKADIVEYGLIYNESWSGVQRPFVVPQQIVIEDSKQAMVAMFKNAIIRFNVWTKIYTSDIVHSYPYDTTRTYEDIRTIPYWILNSAKIVIQPTPEVNWRANKSSIVRDNQIETRLGTCTAFVELCEVFKDDIVIVDSIYRRAMIDLTAMLDKHNSDEPGFNELSAINTKMLSYLYPNDYKNFTYNIEDELGKTQATVISGGKIESEA